MMLGAKGPSTRTTARADFPEGVEVATMVSRSDILETQSSQPGRGGVASGVIKLKRLEGWPENAKVFIILPWTITHF